MKWLTPGGVAASAAVGVAVVWGVGTPGLVLLVTFFVTGSVLTQLTGGAGGQRNVRQVLANGGVAAVAALLGSWAGAAAALAAATADTWATEIGSFSPTPPSLITTGETVPAGTSGAVSMIGTAGGIAGAVVIGVLAGALGPGGWRVGMTTAAAGIAGMMADSILGATLQEKRGLLDNDGVNLAGTALGGGLGVLLSFITR